MQRLLSTAGIVEGEAIAVNSAKPVKEHWIISAIINFIINILLLDFLFNRNAIGKQRFYRGSISQEASNKILFDIALGVSKKSLHLSFCEEDIKNPVSKELKVKFLWNYLIKSGGLEASEDNEKHRLYIKAFIDNKGEKLFAIGNPLGSKYRLIKLN